MMRRCTGSLPSQGKAAECVVSCGAGIADARHAVSRGAVSAVARCQRWHAVQDKKRLNDVWALDLTTLRWFKQNCSGAVPRPRDKASAVFCQGHMVVFGGHTTGKRLNDLCVLDLTSFTWSSWTSVMGQPSPRECAALCVGHGNLLFLHGGASNFGLDDLWVYDQKLQAWIEVAAEGARPPARRGHSLYMHDGMLYLFGGIDELGAPSTAMFRIAVEYGLNLATARLQWEELVSERVFNPNRCGWFPLHGALPVCFESL